MKEIVVIESAFPLTKEEYVGTLGYWKKLGVDLKRPKGVKRPSDLLCASDLKSRLLDVKLAFSTELPPSGLVWALRGGYGMQEILPCLRAKDFTSKATYIGFSDCTSLHYYLNKVLNKASVHGPHPNGFFKNYNSSKILKEVRALIEKPHRYSPEFEGLKLLNSHKKSEISAKIVGGNLTTLCSLLGTPQDKGARGNFLFLEEVEEPAYKVRRHLNHLSQSGFLKAVKAVIFGHFSHSNKGQERLLKKTLSNWAIEQSFPVVSGMQAGHLHKKNHPFWLGKKSKLVLDESPRLLNNI